MTLKGMLIGVLALWPAEAPAATQGMMDLRLHSGTALEEQGRQQLARILKTHDLTKWLFTPVVVIQSRVIPQSHPVLTLNTQYLDDDIAQLATFVHEQLHWFYHQPRFRGRHCRRLRGPAEAIPECADETPRGRSWPAEHVPAPDHLLSRVGSNVGVAGR
jgi:hypothetical protein